MLKKIIKCILVLLCMASIFYFSNDTADQSDKKSSGIIVRISEFFAGRHLQEKERTAKVDQYVLIVRKGAHFSIYFILGVLLISLIREFHVVDWKRMFLAFLIAFLYACSDEIHQLFVSGRSGNIIDVGIDSLGSYFGILCYYYYDRIKRRKYE